MESEFRPLVLLIMLQDSFPASQLIQAQLLEVVPFQVGSKELGMIAQLLFDEDGYDRQAFCQAFANKPACLAAIVCESEADCQKVIRQFTTQEADVGYLLFSEVSPQPRMDTVVTINPDEGEVCDHILRLVGIHAVQPGVPHFLLVKKLQVISGQVKLFRARETLSRHGICP